MSDDRHVLRLFPNLAAVLHLGCDSKGAVFWERVEL